MSTGKRVALALAVLVIDTAVFFVPLSALVLTFVVLARPFWFLDLAIKIYSGKTRK